MIDLMLMFLVASCVAFALLVPWRIKKDDEELRKITDDFIKKLKRDEGK